MNRVQVWVNTQHQVFERHGLHQTHIVDPLVQLDIAELERDVFHQGQYVQGQELQRVGRNERRVPVARNNDLRVSLQVIARHIYHRVFGFLQRAHDCAVDGHLGNKPNYALLVGTVHEFVDVFGDGQTIGVDADPPLALARGVEDRGLEADGWRVGEGLLDRDLHAEAGVRVDVGQGEQVGGPDEEVAVEGVDGEAASAADAHDRLEADFADEVALEVDTEADHLLRVVLDVVLWVVFDFTARVFGYACLRKYKRRSRRAKKK